jgi:hypothetical protein
MNKVLAILLLALSHTLVLVPVVYADQQADSGLMQRTSPYSVPNTLDRLDAALRPKDIKVFARVDA